MPAIFEGRYQGFDEIVDSDQYDDLNIVERIYQHSTSRYKTDGFFPDAISSEYNHIRDITSLCIALLCAETDSTIRILDIGGGFGVSYIELLKRCQLKNFHYTVCEINSFVKYYDANPFFNEKNIAIVRSLKEIKTKQQLLIFGSSLQYFSNHVESIRNHIEAAQFPEYILLTHTPVTHLPAFVTLQVNMSNKKIPNWIFNIDILINIFKENGYRCIHKSAVYREGLFVDFAENESAFRSANCLFKKIKE